MYDDYDLDYIFARDHILDEDTYYEMHIQHLDTHLDKRTHLDSCAHLDAYDCDDDYERESLDYDALAYKHYA